MQISNFTSAPQPSKVDTQPLSSFNVEYVLSGMMPERWDNRKGVIILPRKFDEVYKEVIKEYFVVMTNILGVFDEFEIDEVTLVDATDTDIIDALLEGNGYGTGTVLCDMTGQREGLLPANAISCKQRNGFAGDNATEWRFTGDISNLPDERIAPFYDAAQATFELFLIQSLYGQIREREISEMDSKVFMKRTRELFDALCLGIIEFPMDDEQLLEFHEYMCQLAKLPSTALLRPCTPSAKLLPMPEWLLQYGARVSKATKECRDIQKIWSNCLMDSGSGLSNRALSSSITMNPEAMPLDVPVRRQIAEAIGALSSIESYIEGVPLEDILV